MPILNPPLFSEVDEAAANLASAQASEEITAQNVALEVQQSFVDLVSARERIRTSEVLLTQARENLDLAQGRYQVGVGPLIDVTDAELALTQAESEHIQAIVDFKLSEAGYGRPWVCWSNRCVKALEIAVSVRTPRSAGHRRLGKPRVFWGQQNGAKYRLAAVEKGDISAYVSATGTLNPVIMVQVGTQVSGTIEKLFADYNSPVQTDRSSPS